MVALELSRWDFEPVLAELVAGAAAVAPARRGPRAGNRRRRSAGTTASIMSSTLACEERLALAGAGRLLSRACNVSSSKKNMLAVLGEGQLRLRIQRPLQDGEDLVRTLWPSLCAKRHQIVRSALRIE